MGYSPPEPSEYKCSTLYKKTPEGEAQIQNISDTISPAKTSQQPVRPFVRICRPQNIADTNSPTKIPQKQVCPFIRIRRRRNTSNTSTIQNRNQLHSFNVSDEANIKLQLSKQTKRIQIAHTSLLAIISSQAKGRGRDEIITGKETTAAGKGTNTSPGEANNGQKPTSNTHPALDTKSGDDDVEKEHYSLTIPDD